MDGWTNARKYLLGTALAAGAALVSVTGLHAEMLTSPALPAGGAETSATQGFVPLAQTPVSGGNTARRNASAMLGWLGVRVAEFREELVRELIVTQLTMIGGHPMPPVTVTSTPPVTTTPPPTVTSTPPVTTPTPPVTTPPPAPPPPVTTGNPPPPPTPPSPPTPPPPGGGGQPPDPTPPPPPSASPEPASLVLGLLGAGLVSLGAWRRRKRNAEQNAA